LAIQTDSVPGDSSVKDEAQQARVVALSLAHCTSIVTLLRASRQEELAAGVEAAIGATMGLVANELGRETLTKAMDWARGELHADIELPDLRAYHN
jgi:hypothetical protein